MVEGSGIIYALTKRDVGVVTEWLRTQGLNVKAYTGESGEERPMLERELLENKVKALVATTALGMGYDKPDLAFVIHYQAPGSVVAYYQQVGRAGRALELAHGILLSGQEEGDINEYFIRSAFPSREEVQEVLDALEEAEDGLSIPGLQAKVNLDFGRIEKTVQLLSLESPPPIVKDGTKWKLTTAVLNKDFWARAERLTVLRRAECEQVQQYVGLSSGHMDFLVRALDGDPADEPLPALEPLDVVPAPAVLQEATEFLKRISIPFPPRKQWPSGGMEVMGLRGNFPKEVLNMEGRALCMLGDKGWSKLVEKGKYKDHCFDDDLLSACVDLVKEWDGADPAWVTFVPSITQRDPDSLKEFSQRLAAELGLPLVETLETMGPAPGQKAMKNSIRKALNLDGAFAVRSGLDMQGGAVLLVDDLVDSRWSMTVAGYLLLKHGSGPVFPLALAMVGGK
jgi:ATP-dependent DNA helicase RecQ